MSRRSKTSYHLADLYRITTEEGITGQVKVESLVDADMRTSIHSRGSLQTTDQMQWGSETDVDFYFDYDPQVQIEDEFRNIRLKDGTAVTPDVTYSVDSAAVNLGMRNRLWRVSCVVKSND